MIKNYWIQHAHPRKGALSRQLGIPISKNIPILLLVEIAHYPIGSTYFNHFGVGKPRIKITRLLKKRVSLAITLKRLRS